MIEPRCKSCGRFLNVEPKGTVVIRIRCPKQSCKTWNNLKVVNQDSSQADIRYKFETSK